MSDKPKSPLPGGKGQKLRATSAEMKSKSRLAALAPGENIKEKQVGPREHVVKSLA